MFTASTKVKHLLSIGDMDPEVLFGPYLEGCADMIRWARGRKVYTVGGMARKIIPDALKPKVQLLFFEPSTRTRGSFREASMRIGCRTDSVMGVDATSLTKKESMGNTARMFAIYGADVIVVRSKIEGAPRFMAEVLERKGCDVAVINAGDGTNQHPTQTILDLLTIKQRLGRLNNLKIGFFGDLKYGRTVHSLLSALRHRTGIKVVLVSPTETELQEYYKFREFDEVIVGDSMEMLAGCDIVYGARVQEERFAGDPVNLLRWSERYRITQQLLDLYGQNVFIMHPMPYVGEFPPDVRPDMRIIIDDQAWHGIPSRMFELHTSIRNTGLRPLLAGDDGVKRQPLRDPVSLEEYMAQREQKKPQGKYYNPLMDGVVIDRIPPGLGARICDLLERSCRLDSDSVVHLIKRVPSASMDKKDVIILPDQHPGDDVLALIHGLCEGVRFNEVKDDQVFKFRMDRSVPMKGVGRCPNANCITNHDPEASTRFLSRGGGKTLKCSYCEKHFARSEI